MKKILMLLAVAACAVSAQAYTSYAYMEVVAGTDAATALPLWQANMGKYYQAYTLSTAKLQSNFSSAGFSDGSSAQDVATWLSDNLADAKDVLGDFTKAYQGANFKGVASGLSIDKSKAGQELNVFQLLVTDSKGSLKIDHTAMAEATKWTVLFYENGDEQALTVLKAGNTAGYYPVGDGGYRTKVTSFADVATVNVPEPTSGLLLLLGVVGLALKRRRA